MISTGKDVDEMSLLTNCNFLLKSSVGLRQDLKACEAIFKDSAVGRP